MQREDVEKYLNGVTKPISEIYNGSFDFIVIYQDGDMELFNRNGEHYKLSKKIYTENQFGKDFIDCFSKLAKF